MTEPAQQSENSDRAIVYRRTGGPQMLEMTSRHPPAPGPGEVRVRLHRAGVNPTDWKSRQGANDGSRVDPPQIPGQDGAGVVDAVGEGVGSALHGLRVWTYLTGLGRPEGTAADHAILPERRVVPLPDQVSDDVGASLGVPFLTAHRCLTVAESGPDRLGPGRLSDRVVLVQGGAGAVGNAAIQLARWSGATIIATISSAEKAQLAAAAGASHVINYRDEDVVAEIGKISPRGVDMIVEVAAAANAATDAAVLAQGGSVAAYGGQDGDEAVIDVRTSMAGNARWQFVLLYYVPNGAIAAAVDDVGAALLDGAIGVGEADGLPLHHYPLEQVAEAHRAVENGAVGKVLLDIRQ